MSTVPNCYFKMAASVGDTFSDAAVSDILLNATNGGSTRAILTGFSSTVAGAPAVQSAMRITTTSVQVHGTLSAATASVAGGFAANGGITVGGVTVLDGNANGSFNSITTTGSSYAPGRSNVGGTSFMTNSVTAGTAVVTGAATFAGAVTMNGTPALSVTTITASGNVTAASFTGSVSGTATGLSGSPAVTVASVNATGNVTAASFNGPLAGTSTGLAGSPNISVGGVNCGGITCTGTINAQGGISGNFNATGLTGNPNISVNMITANGTLQVNSGISGNFNATGLTNIPTIDVQDVVVHGNIGLGTYTPGYPLHVVRTQNNTFTNYNYVEYGNGNSYNAGTSPSVPVSILTTGYIVCKSLYANSDRRVKRDIIDIPDDVIYDLMNSIQPRLFKYIDVVGNEPMCHAGFIAQEVENATTAIIPHVVGIHSGDIPSIMTLCSFRTDGPDPAVLTISGLTGAVLDTLTIDTRLSLRDGCNEVMHATVMSLDKSLCEITVNLEDPHMFDREKAAGKIFMYGQTVDDFRSVDHKQIAAVSTAAIKRLMRDVGSMQHMLASMNGVIQSQGEAIAALQAGNQ